MKNPRGALILLLSSALLTASGHAQSRQVSPATGQTWIQEMKAAPRGPFQRLRWFCKDGTVHPPKPYACSKRGGGYQHGEWNDQTKRLRASGYMIANVLAGLDPKAFRRDPNYVDTYNQILIEQFLIAADNGWILRKALYYRGAFQIEDEREGARKLLISLAGNSKWATERFLQLRLGAQLLPHGRETQSVNEVRRLSAALSDRDQGFISLRNKIHIKPEASDAAQVRKYAAGVSNASLRSEYERLATLIDQVFGPRNAPKLLHGLAGKTSGALAQSLSQGAAELAGTRDAARRLEIIGELMAAIRNNFTGISRASTRLEALGVSLALETAHFAAGTELRNRLSDASRRDQLSWLQASAAAVYGAGFITPRELGELKVSFARLPGGNAPLSQYKSILDYLDRVPGWSTQWVRHYFGASVEKLGRLESKAHLFPQDVVRGSPVFLYSSVLDSLLQDANRLAGVRQELFGEEVGGGLRSLNPGLARGTLRLAQSGDSIEQLDLEGIYLLPETTSDLPPLAGILTAGEGNPLSHVQLLARNLGIPNVGIDESLISRLSQHEGKTIVLVVSPAGSVQLAEDNDRWQALFSKEEKATRDVLIRPDLEKLDLTTRRLIPLDELRASDSGRTVGPKAAKLGELRSHFPEAVSDGLAIPFGIFRAMLDQPIPGEDSSVYDWMVAQYRRIRAMPEGLEREAFTEKFRTQLYDWVLNADPGSEFRDSLRQAMAERFGEDGSYGMFVRSDTNVEDLPGFTGAGLNLTVPNVVGFDQLLKAISQVWASPFSARAYAWRQSHMDQPQHVYPAVLLLQSVPSEKSGVLVTQDIDTGRPAWLSVVVNEGVGGGVDGQAAESLRVDTASGEVILLAQATAPTRRVVQPKGGIAEVPVSGSDYVLSEDEISQLIAFSKELPKQFPELKDAQGNPAPTDVEFGFLDGKLRLFQIRPFLESQQARSSSVLQELDTNIRDQHNIVVALDSAPEENAL